MAHGWKGRRQRGKLLVVLRRAEAKFPTDLVEEDGFQQSALEYPGLSKDEIFEAVDRFYRTYYLRPKPILRIIKTMLEDKDVCVRRLREGYEFFKSLRQRKIDLAASQASQVAAA